MILPVKTTVAFTEAVNALSRRTLTAHRTLPGAIIAHWAWVSAWGTRGFYASLYNYGEVPWGSVLSAYATSGPPDGHGRLCRFRSPNDFVDGYLLYFGDMLDHDAVSFFDAMRDIEPRAPVRWDRIKELWETSLASQDGVVRE